MEMLHSTLKNHFLVLCILGDPNPNQLCLGVSLSVPLKTRFRKLDNDSLGKFLDLSMPGQLLCAAK
jgi:hypothetical protein